MKGSGLGFEFQMTFCASQVHLGKEMETTSLLTFKKSFKLHKPQTFNFLVEATNAAINISNDSGEIQKSMNENVSSCAKTTQTKLKMILRKYFQADLESKRNVSEIDSMHI